MPDDLATLETQRSKLLEEFLDLGDLRPGSITAVTRRCGKPSCHCAKHNDPGHDPQFRLTRRISGKTVTESFPNPTALRKAQQEGAAALTELLQFEAPAADQRQLPCRCGHHAQYQEIRSKPTLTIVGPVRIARPYYLCSQCHLGQFPVDVELDIENTEFSPGV